MKTEDAIPLEIENCGISHEKQNPEAVSYGEVKRTEAIILKVITVFILLILISFFLYLWTGFDITRLLSLD